MRAQDIPRSVIFFIFIFMLIMIIVPDTLLNARIYKYTDDNGIIHFSDQPFSKRHSSFHDYIEEDIEELDCVESTREKFYDNIIYKASILFEVDPALLKAIIKVESDFDSKAVSRAGAKGLMQLMPKTAYNMEVIDPFDPEDNIIGGTKYFKYLLNRFQNNLKISLAAYNAGETAVNSAGGIPRFRETRDFVKKVLQYYEIYKKVIEKNLNRNNEEKDEIIQFVDDKNIIHITNLPGRYLKRLDLD